MIADKSRTDELKIGLADDLRSYPKDVDYDLDAAIPKKDWTRCNDSDTLSSIFRKWRDETIVLFQNLRKDTESILKIDIKEDLSEEDKVKRAMFIDNIERYVGKGNGENWLGWDSSTRWDKIVVYHATQDIYPREKLGRENTWTTMSYNGHLVQEQRSVDRAHNQVHNQNIKNCEIFVDGAPPGEKESQLLIRLGNVKRHKELLQESIVLHRLQENVILKRLAALKNNGDGDNYKKLLSSSDSSDKFDQYSFSDVKKMFDEEGI